MDDYKDHPKSVTELRSDKTDKASDWTPRDVLIAMLRKIDSGEITDIKALSVVWTVDGKSSWSSTSSPYSLMTIGMLTNAANGIGVD